jgi:hypothetical protein
MGDPSARRVSLCADGQFSLAPNTEPSGGKRSRTARFGGKRRKGRPLKELANCPREEKRTSPQFSPGSSLHNTYYTKHMALMSSAALAFSDLTKFAPRPCQPTSPWDCHQADTACRDQSAQWSAARVFGRSRTRTGADRYWPAPASVPRLSGAPGRRPVSSWSSAEPSAHPAGREPQRRRPRSRP